MKKTFSEQHLPEVIDFVKKHAPKVPNFIEENRPKFDPGFTLGPALSARKDPSLLEAYFGQDIRQLLLDVSNRPDHYTEEQKNILRALERKEPLPPGTTTSDINNIVLRFTERTEQRKKREEVVRSAQRKLEDLDPTVERRLREEEEQRQREEAEKTYEKMNFPKAIKII